MVRRSRPGEPLEPGLGLTQLCQLSAVILIQSYPLSLSFLICKMEMIIKAAISGLL